MSETADRTPKVREEHAYSSDRWAEDMLRAAAPRRPHAYARIHGLKPDHPVTAPLDHPAPVAEKPPAVVDAIRNATRSNLTHAPVEPERICGV
jgi:hypothetical protein